MKKQDALLALKKMREISPKRKFTQSVELMINFTGLDMKKPQNQVNVKVELPHSTGKGSGKIAVFAKSDAFVDGLKGKVDTIIEEKDIEALAKDKAKLVELMAYDALFAEGPVLLTVARFLGQQLATKGKMPKPILNLLSFDEVLAKAKTQVTISNKKGKFMPVVQTVVGKETTKDDDMAENMVAIYNVVMNSLPQKKQNVKNAYVKFSMGPVIKVGEVQ